MRENETPGGWRTVDIVVTAALGVAFGAVFQAWNLAWTALLPVFGGFPPLQATMYGVWLLPAVLAGLIVRRPGAAILAETVAALTSVLFGAPWGLQLVIYGVMQGGAAELVFAVLGYRSWGLAVAVLAAAAAGAAAALLDVALFYAAWAPAWQLAFGGLVILSAAVVAGIGGWLLVRALAQTGVLAPFPSGRLQRPI